MTDTNSDMMTTKTLILLRGLPGSGKSSVARNIQEECISKRKLSCVIHSTDDFHLEVDPTTGKMVYVFKADKLREFHQLNLRDASASMKHDIHCVIVDNTNTTWKEMEPYVKVAKQYGYDILIVEPNTPWAKDVDECAKRNTHNVPKEAIQRMLGRYEDRVSIKYKLEQLESK